MTTDTTLTRPVRLGLAAIAAAVGVLMLLPALGHAAKASFGADLGAGGYTPVAAKQGCILNPNKSCTRVAAGYSQPSHAGFTPSAPKSGVIKKIKLVSDTPGSLKIQIAKRSGAGLYKTKIKRNGPRLYYQGTGSVEKFKVHIPVKKGQWLAFKSKKAGTLSCGSGNEDELQYQPALKKGAANNYNFDASNDCTHLVSARMKY